MRFVAIFVGGAVLWWGLSLVSHTWQSTDLRSQERAAAEESLLLAISEVERASQSLDAKIREAGVGEDLSNGWEDLRSDTLSVLREMSRRSDLEYIRAFTARVDGFWETYAPSSEIGPDIPEWRQFETALYNAIGVRELVSWDVSISNES